MKAKLLLIFSFLLFFEVQNFAQENTYQTWLDYDHQYKKSGNWRFFSDYGFRWQSTAGLDNWFRLHARPSVGYRPSALMDYRGGVGVFFTQNQYTANQFEIRPWQGVIIGWPNLNRFRFFNYFRLEERISTRIEQSTNFVLKFRYKIGVKIPLNNSVIAVKTYYVHTSLELFLDLTSDNNEQNNDRTRFELGMGYRWTNKTTVKVLYTLQRIFNNQNDGVDFSEGFAQNDHVLRITVSQRIGFD